MRNAIPRRWFEKRLLSAVVALAVLPGLGTNYYVSETGSDTENDGKSESSPFRSPEYALKKATASWDNVYVMKGVYKLTETPQIRQHNIGLFGHKATRDEIVFDGQGQMRCLQFKTNVTGEVEHMQNFRLQGITFRNGYTSQASSWANWFGQGAGALLSSHNGGGSGYKVTITDCVFEGCTNKYCNGGGLSITADGSVVSNCVFRNNMTQRIPSTANGGAMGGGAGAYVVATSGSNALFTHCTFVGNTSTNGVAALGAGAYSNNYGHFTNGTGVVVKHCTFINNQSVNNGTSGEANRSAGCLSQKAWLAEDCTFVSNRADVVNGTAGGGVYTCTYKMTPARTNTFRRCTFFRNSANGSGGVFHHSSASPLVFDECNFTSNSTRNASGNAVCVYATSAPVTMTDCVATGNYVNAEGVWHGLFQIGTGSQVSRCRFIKNSDKGWTGIVKGEGTITVEDSIFAGNKHTGSGTTSFGYVKLAGADSLVRNCLFADNASSSGVAGGVWVDKSGVCIENCTFVSNKTTSATASVSGGAAIAGGGGATIVNCLFVQNTAPSAKYGQISTNLTASIRCCWADTAGTVPAGENGNLPVGDGKPYFDATSEYAYVPSRRTPGRDKAQVLDWMRDGVDVYGRPRIVGIAPDFGCAEHPVPYIGMMLLFR